MSEKTCDGCDGKCCRYVVLEIDIPENLDDFENIKWYVAHKNVAVFIDEEHSWNIEFITPCEHLGKDSRCQNYETRPKICREYSQEDCPFHNDYKEPFRFECIADVEKYIEEVFKKGNHKVPLAD
jgi:Fe-S-cluster containining protein